MIQAQIPNQAVIETERLILRPLRASDAGLLDLYGGDRRVAQMTTSIPHPLPPGATEAFIKASLDPKRVEDVWALDGLKSGLSELVGVIGLERMDREQSEIGYWTAPAFWKMGLMREAVEALLAANPQDQETIFGSVFQDNPASSRVLMSCGFTYIGDAEAHSVSRGATVPTWTYHKRLKH
ncbi:MAG: GNAT family N-acetyltransferase [Pseudomonadota bacterium]